MKKLFSAMSTVVAVVALAACGSEEPSQVAGEQVVEEQVVAETVTKEFGNVSIDVPSVFSDVTEQDGMFAASAPNGSITVTPLEEVELLPTEWNEEVAQGSLEALYSGAYSDMELAAFEGNLELNGSPAVYYAFTGTASDGQEHLVHAVRLFNKDVTAQYFIAFIHVADDENYDADMSGEIINSIALAADAQ